MELYTQSHKRKEPWVNKYRPKKLTHIMGQDDIIKVLTNSLETGDLPHMLLYGRPGTGKTSSILAYAYQLFGPRLFEERVLELNASDDRGINIVRNNIYPFAKKMVGNGDPRYPSPPFKLIILDEADAMTNEAQAALRIIMENYSHITRFCFICNYLNQIIDPIQSRCTKFRFKPINQENLIIKLKSITDNENINVTDDVINKIASIVQGDVRKGIMTLQNLKYVYDKTGKLTVDDVYDITGFVPYDMVTNIFNKCIDKNTTVVEIYNDVNDMYKKGYTVYSILDTLTKLIIECNKLNDKQKGQISFNMSSIEKRLIDGASEFVQIIYIFTDILICVKH